MSADLLAETRLSLNQLAREQDVALSTCWRWALRGVRGHRLECFSLGGRRYTTREAFTRFVERTTAAATGEPVPSRTNRQRERDIAAAQRELAESGI